MDGTDAGRTEAALERAGKGRKEGTGADEKKAAYQRAKVLYGAEGQRNPALERARRRKRRRRLKTPSRGRSWRAGTTAGLISSGRTTRERCDDTRAMQRPPGSQRDERNATDTQRAGGEEISVGNHHAVVFRRNLGRPSPDEPLPRRVVPPSRGATRRRARFATATTMPPSLSPAARRVARPLARRAVASRASSPPRSWCASSSPSCGFDASRRAPRTRRPRRRSPTCVPRRCPPTSSRGTTPVTTTRSMPRCSRGSSARARPPPRRTPLPLRRRRRRLSSREKPDPASRPRESPQRVAFRSLEPPPSRDHGRTPPHPRSCASRALGSRSGASRTRRSGGTRTRSSSKPRGCPSGASKRTSPPAWPTPGRRHARRRRRRRV